MPFKIIRNDITKMCVDAIINASNTALRMGGGVSGDIFSAAGAEMMQAECNRIGHCDIGGAVITSGYNLPARYVIHTAGPIWQDGKNNEAKYLHDCYINSLNLAMKYKCETVAFPLISSGIYGYPKDKALHAAISAISSFLMEHEMMVYLVVYDTTALMLSEKLFSAVEQYISTSYIKRKLQIRPPRQPEPYGYRRSIPPERQYDLYGDSCAAMPAPKAERSIRDIFNQLDETFSQMLLRLIDERGMTDVQAYKKANVDRKLFSKIRSDHLYNPSKATAIAFAIGLELNLDQTLDLLKKAGYTLSHSNKFDLIIEYFIEAGNYNIYEINITLFDYDQVPLGA